MVFASATFLFLFFPLTIIVYYILTEKYRNLWLFFASFIFYAWSGMIYALLILFSTFVNYFVGLLMDICEGKRKKWCLIIGIAFNLGLLGFFKYFNFIVLNLETVIRFLLPEFDFHEPVIPLPIGISFFTFQIMSYVIDLYRGDIRVQKNFINLGLYIMLFPQLIAGPIVRYIDVQEQIFNRTISLESFEIGLKRFILGLAKKVCIANAMGMWADAAFNVPGRLNMLTAWLGAIAYTMQIFFDFSAYSDMAIGLGKMFGFDFLENFNYPYIAKTMQDFWRRWHMSLTTWFRDYLYIPLGGNRKGKLKTYRNNLIVFFFTGMWHGASWNFIVWGMFHGFFLILEKSWLNKYLKRMSKLFLHCYTMFLVIVGWVFFRAEDLSQALYYLKQMFGFRLGDMEYFWGIMDNWKIIMLVCAFFFSTPIIPKMISYIKHRLDFRLFEVLENVGYSCLFIVSIMFVAGASFNPFIYFRF